ncbi:thioredoxin domain-containing protein [Phthorimaea operculella]|nr:thioredoxin domain-containing protein [Phthorimaea operculella]
MWVAENLVAHRPDDNSLLLQSARDHDWCNPVETSSVQSTYDEGLVKIVTDHDALDLALVEAGRKLVVLAFLLLGDQQNDRILQYLADKARTYQNSLVVLLVDVATSGHLATTCEAHQIPWFIFLRDARQLEAYHSISNDKIENTIRTILGEEPIQKIRTYVKNTDDLDKRLSEFKDKLVLVAFMIPGDESGERLNIDLDELEERNEAIHVLKVDVDTCKDLTKKYNIQGVPTIVFIKNNTVLEQMSALEINKLGPEVTKFINGEKDETWNINAGLKMKTPSASLHMASSHEKQYSNVPSRAHSNVQFKNTEPTN